MSIECNVCKKDLAFLSVLSPMIERELWNQILNHYHLSEDRPGPDLPAMTPKYCCYECMEKALGRKLTPEDIKLVPFNLYFRLHYFYKIPVSTVRQIFKHMKFHVLNSPTFNTEKLQREYDYMNGVLMPFTMLQDPEYAKSLSDFHNLQATSPLQSYSDKELRDDLKRRIAERKAANAVKRCRDCKHCGEGCCNHSSRYKTSVCFLKPKPQFGANRYYATLHSRKACEKFEPK